MVNSAEFSPNPFQQNVELPNNPEIIRGEVPLVAALKEFENGQEIRKEIPQDVKLKDTKHKHFAVFDGVSTSVGEEASNRAALESARYLGSYLDQKVKESKSTGEDVEAVVVKTIKESFKAAQKNIDQFTKSLTGVNETDLKAQTTAAVVRFVEGKAYFASIGDSEIWRYRDGQLDLLNEFDSAGTELYKMGQISAEQAQLFNRANNLESLKESLYRLEKKDPIGQKFPIEAALLIWKNTSQTLSACIGTESGQKVYDVPVGIEQLKTGDLYLVASDGNILSKERIKEIIEAGKDKTTNQLEEQIQTEADYISSSNFEGTAANKEFGGQHPLAKPDDVAAVLYRYTGEKIKPKLVKEEIFSGSSKKNQYAEKVKIFQSELVNLSEEEADDLRDKYLREVEEIEEQVIDVEVGIASVKDDLETAWIKDSQKSKLKLAELNVSLIELQTRKKELEYKAYSLRLEIIEPGLKRTVDKTCRDIPPLLKENQKVFVDGETARILGVSPNKKEYFILKDSEKNISAMGFIKKNRFAIEVQNFSDKLSFTEQDRIRNAVEPMDIVLNNERLKNEWEGAERRLVLAIRHKNELLHQIKKEQVMIVGENKRRGGAAIHDQAAIQEHLQAMEAKKIAERAFIKTKTGEVGEVDKPDTKLKKVGIKGFFSKFFS